MEHIGAYLSYLYLLRVPILTWLLLVLLPFLSVPRRAPLGSLLRGIFDLSGGGAGQFAVSFALLAFVSFMAAVAAGLTARLILLDGEARFSAGPIPVREPGVKLSFRIFALLAPLPLISLALIETYYRNRLAFWEILAGIFGVAVGIVAFFFAMTRLDDWLWDLAFVRNDLRKADAWDLALSRDDLREADTGVQRTSRYKPNLLLDLIARCLATTVGLAQRIVTVSPKGYVVPSTGKLWNRHAFALLHLILSLAFYVGLYLTKWNRIASIAPPRIPTLCLLLGLIMLGCFALSALTFFFDRFRIPLLSLIVLYAFFSAQLPQTDHFFKSSALGRDPSTSADVSTRCTNAKDAPVVLVAASGGGIQSAAWTAIVLSGLKQDLRQEGVNFDCSIKVISSVSGGSVGAMYFADAYRADGTLPPPDGEGDLRNYAPVKNAEASSLDAVAWGLAYPDLGWSIAPFLKGIGFHPLTLLNGKNLTNDRGTALENAWRTTPSLEKATLSGWREDSVRGSRPAVIFNSTIVETGERFLISTANLETSIAQQLPSSRGRKMFSELYQDRDLDIVTGARLSATFPYATPAARIWKQDAFAKSYHIADGGYYDNYGIVSLLDWLDFRSRELAPYPKRVIIIQIRGFRTQSSPLPAQHHGTLFEFLQPLQTLLHVRDTGQFSHNEVDMTFAQRANTYPFPVYSVDFEFDEKDDAGDPVEPPLSWHLTFIDKYFLHHYWSSEPMQRKREEFRKRFLAP